MLLASGSPRLIPLAGHALQPVPSFLALLWTGLHAFQEPVPLAPSASCEHVAQSTAPLLFPPWQPGHLWCAENSCPGEMLQELQLNQLCVDVAKDVHNEGPAVCED